MKAYVLKYGIFGGLLSIVLGLINWFTVAQFYGPGPSQALGYLSIILSLMCVPLGIKYYRDRLNKGHVSFPKALKIGAGISLVASIITFLYGILFFVFAGDRFAEWSKMGLNEMELQELEMQMQQRPEFVNTPWFQGLILGLSVFLIGFLISVISGFFLKRTPEQS